MNKTPPKPKPVKPEKSQSSGKIKPSSGFTTRSGGAGSGDPDKKQVFLPGLFVVNGLLCLVALGVSFGVKQGRDQATILAALLGANFLFCGLAYTDYAPKQVFQALGLDVTSKDLWMVADTLFGCAAMIAYRYWWGWALCASALIQVLTHGAYAENRMSEWAYTDILGYVLLGQLAVFFMIGARGAAEYLHSHADRRSLRRVQKAPVHKADEA